MTQLVAFKITDIHNETSILTDSVEDAMPTIRSWYEGTPADQWEETDQLLQQFEDSHLADDVLENALGLRFEEVLLEDLETDLQDAQANYTEAQSAADHKLEARNKMVIDYHNAGLGVTRIAEALGVTRPIVYKILSRAEDLIRASIKDQKTGEATTPWTPSLKS